LTIALFIKGLLGSEQSVCQAASVTCERDTGLDGCHATSLQVRVAFSEQR
jgi:hypothetical protein